MFSASQLTEWLPSHTAAEMPPAATTKSEAAPGKASIPPSPSSHRYQRGTRGCDQPPIKGNNHYSF